MTLVAKDITNHALQWYNARNEQAKLCNVSGLKTQSWLKQNMNKIRYNLGKKKYVNMSKLGG